MDAAIEGHLAAGRHARAFDLIVPEFRNRVFRLAFSILKDRAAAEDAAQETLVRVWKALSGFDGRAALGTWIYAITRNTCLMELRKRADEMREELLRLPEITQVKIEGERDYEITLEFSENALRQYRLRLDDVVSRIRQQSRDLPGGKIRTEGQTITLRSTGQARTAARQVPPEDRPWT